MTKEKEKKPLVNYKGTKECSYEFWESLHHRGSLAIDCEACGRTHFGGDGDFEPGELEDLLNKQKTDPDRFISHGDLDYVDWTYIFGMQVVLNCPCRYLSHLEGLLWRDREEISAYFLARAKKEKAAADKTLGQAEETSAALTQPPIGPQNRDESRALRK